jgi:colanic acid/amylovoran biosynthesis glycosyltransferase
MKTFPLAVISSSFGKKSETFIHRHMRQLLPGKTAVIVRKLVLDSGEDDIPSPCCVFGARRNLSWFYHGSRYRLGLSKFSPTQMVVARFLKQHGVQVILSEYLDQSLKWLVVARNLGIRFFAHAHGYDVSMKLRDSYMRRNYLQLEAADGIITMNVISRQRLIALGLSRKKIHVIPYGINVPDQFFEREQRQTIQCLAVGRMVAKKAPLLTLLAFKNALDCFPFLRLDYVGDGELFTKAQQFVDDHFLNEQIKLYGALPNYEIQKMMQKADIFLQHSRTDPETGDEEGLPVAILEAMANGLPVVSTRHAGIPEAIVEGGTGYLVDEGDVVGMSEHILSLANDAKLRSKIGKSGWQRANAHFTWAKEKESLLKLLLR